MTKTEMVVQGTLKEDGTLELDDKPDLPPGRVSVTLRVADDSPQPRAGWWEVLQRIWEEQARSGHKGRSREDIDAQIDALRNEWEERQAELERIREAKPREPEKPAC